VETLLGWFDAQGLPGLVRLGVSPPATGVPAVPTVAAQARSALAEAFYRPRDRIYAYRPDTGRVFDLADDTIALWRRLMEAEDHAGMVRQLELLEQRALSLRDSDHGRVRTVWLRALELLLEYVPAWGASERTVRVAKLGRDLDASPDLPSLAAEARGCFERLFILSPGTLHVGDRIQKARLYIEERFADPDLTVDAIAVYVGFSESYFCTVFKQSQGMTVKDFVTRHRIERAKAYLWEKDPPTLADLALKVGFRDPNYFSTVFKRLSGTSPGAYRKKALG
jgi:two-component system response regulator YesN